MPRYFFHTQTDTRFSDDEGTEFSSSAEARRAAIQTCGEIMREGAETFWGSRPWHVSVTDSSGLVLWEIVVNGSTAIPRHEQFSVAQTAAPSDEGACLFGATLGRTRNFASEAYPGIQVWSLPAASFEAWSGVSLSYC